jgi:2-hydroxychromene-2-carboxylate isomerase
VQLVLFVSFSCPYSYLASLRGDRLVQSGAADIEWRAVVHNTDLGPEGRQVIGEVAEHFDEELEEIRGLLKPGEDYPARRPPVDPNPSQAVAGFATMDGEPADNFRRALFEAVWVDGLDIGDRSVLANLGCPQASPGERATTWQQEWEDTERHVVPMLVLPDGKVSRGLGALSRLAEMMGKTPGELTDGTSDSSAGDPACWAHMVCPECGGVTSAEQSGQQGDGHKAGCTAG